MLSNIIKYNIDIVLVSEPKLDCFFPNAQFVIEGYAPPFRYDRNSYGGSVLLFVREEILVKIIDKSLSKEFEFEGLFVESPW